MGAVPKQWNETIEAHRREVRNAIIDAAAALVSNHGLLSVTMSQIAETTGIGRATLYNHFSNVEAILSAWHQRQVRAHLGHLAKARDDAANASDRLQAVLEAYAFIAHASAEHRGSELAAFLHRDPEIAKAEDQVQRMLRDLLTEGAEAGRVRSDVAPDELASYCLSALGAARTMTSKAAVRRLVSVTLAALKP